MRSHEKIQTLLNEVHPLYETIHQKKRQREILQNMVVTYNEFEARTAEEGIKLAALEKCKDELEVKKRKLDLGLSIDSVGPTPIQSRSFQLKPTQRSWKSVKNGPLGTPNMLDKTADLRTRKHLKRLVNRWSRSWDMEQLVLSQFNSILDDSERHPGEALQLLDWDIFADPTMTHETEDMHLERIIEWQGVLAEYWDRLVREIDVLTTRYRDWISIWEEWHLGVQGIRDQARWERFVEQARRDKQEKIAQLETQIAQLEVDIETLKTQSGFSGN